MKTLAHRAASLLRDDETLDSVIAYLLNVWCDAREAILEAERQKGEKGDEAPK